MPHNEIVRRYEHRLEVASSVGIDQGLSLDAIGSGLVLLTVSGEVLPSEPDTAYATITRDTLREDVAPWLKAHAAAGTSEGTAEIVSHAFRLAELYQRSGPVVAEGLTPAQQAELANFRGVVEGVYGEASSPDRPSDFDADTDPSLQRWLNLKNAAGGVFEALLSPDPLASHLSRALGEPLSAEIRTAFAAAPEAAKKLYRPLGTLVTLELIKRNSIKGLYRRVTHLAKYGLSHSKLELSVPASLNRQPIPMTPTDTTAFADHAIRVADS